MRVCGANVSPVSDVGRATSPQPSIGRLLFSILKSLLEAGCRLIARPTRNFSHATLFALFAVPAAAANWIQVSAPSIEIFTDTSENTARALLDRFETLNRIFRESNIAGSPPRLRVFIFDLRTRRLRL